MQKGLSILQIPFTAQTNHQNANQYWDQKHARKSYKGIVSFGGPKHMSVSFGGPKHMRVSFGGPKHMSVSLGGPKLR